ncbi:MAG: hypothetical protein WAV28_16060, partial [Sedimentisphaerales bacterium]
MKRREFLVLSTGMLGGLCMRSSAQIQPTDKTAKESKKPFKISLAQWSLHRRLFGRQKPKLDNLDFAK